MRTVGAGVNFADCITRMGLYRTAKEHGYPITPGFEFSGRVLALGEGVRDLRVGAAVLGVSFFGGYAEELCVPRSFVFPLPTSVDPLAAAGFPAVSLTAWYALRELAPPKPGSTVLVHSAAGGVGGMLCCLARLAGARVIGTVGRRDKVEVAEERGAHEVLVRTEGELWRRARELAPEGFDAVFDASGPDTLRQGWDALAPGGRLVCYGFHAILGRSGGRPSWLRLLWGWLRLPRFSPFGMTHTNRSVHGFNLSTLFHRGELLERAMAELLTLVEEGRLTLPPTRSYSLEGVGQAHRELESGNTVGKLVLRMD